VAADDVVAATGFALEVPAEIPATAEPTATQVALLRERIDPLGTVKIDFVPGKERLAYMKGLLDAEWAQVTGAPPPA
jgi:hypothetical protein